MLAGYAGQTFGNGALDLIRVSAGLKEAIKQCSVIVGVGNVNYETMNGIDKDTYHVLVVHGSAAEIATGYREGDYVLMHNKAGTKYLPSPQTLLMQLIQRAY